MIWFAEWWAYVRRIPRGYKARFSRFKGILLQGEVRICFTYQHKTQQLPYHQNDGLLLSFLSPQPISENNSTSLNHSQPIFHSQSQPPTSPSVLAPWPLIPPFFGPSPRVMATASRTRWAVSCSGTSKDFSRKFSTSKLRGMVPLPAENTWDFLSEGMGVEDTKGDIYHTGVMDISWNRGIHDDEWTNYHPNILVFWWGN